MHCTSIPQPSIIVNGRELQWATPPPPQVFGVSHETFQFKEVSGPLHRCTQIVFLTVSAFSPSEVPKQNARFLSSGLRQDSRVPRKPTNTV